MPDLPAERKVSNVILLNDTVSSFTGSVIVLLLHLHLQHNHHYSIFNRHSQVEKGKLDATKFQRKLYQLKKIVPRDR